MAKVPFIMPPYPTMTLSNGITLSGSGITLSGGPSVVKSKPKESQWEKLLKAAKKDQAVSIEIHVDAGPDMVEGYIKFEKIRLGVESHPGKGYTLVVLYQNEWNGQWGSPHKSLKYGWALSEEIANVNIKKIIIHSAKEKAKPQVNMENLLDRVILPTETKSEILSVLKQHANKDKIFKEWGLEETVSYGFGMTFLFHGGPGTGKTLTARLIAEGLSKKLQTLDVSKIQSSEPGESCRALERAFAKATEEKAVLLLDECDSFIGSRNNLGMILSGEVNALLQLIEKFTEILILTTNRIGDLDEALERRISLIVEYKDPDPKMRHDIFEAIIPKKMPLSKCVNKTELADYPLTGGQIKNVVLGAARLAAAEKEEKVKHEHFVRSIRRTLSSRGRFGQKNHLVYSNATKTM